MSDKEWLEKIKRKFDLDRVGRIEDSKLISPQDLLYLIQQAERVQELELEVNDWRDEVKKWQRFYKESEESHLETKELLRSTLNQNKRYREALNTIIKLWVTSTDATGEHVKHWEGKY